MDRGGWFYPRLHPLQPLELAQHSAPLSFAVAAAVVVALDLVDVVFRLRKTCHSLLDHSYVCRQHLRQHLYPLLELIPIKWRDRGNEIELFFSFVRHFEFDAYIGK